MILIKIYESIDEINKQDWNALATNSSVFYDYGWFKTFQHLLGQPLFIAAYKENKLVGLLPGFIVTDVATYVYHNPKDALLCRNEVDLARFVYRTRDYKSWFILKMLSRGSKILEPIINRRLFPAYVCISPRGFVGDILSETDDIMDCIIQNLDIICKKKSIQTKCIMWVHEDNVKLDTYLRRSGFLKLVGELDFNIDLKWNSIGEMIENMVGVRRRRFKKDMNKFDYNKCKIEFHEGNKWIMDNIKDIVSLARKHASTCGDLLSKFDIEKIYKDFCENLGNRIYIIAAKNNNLLVGFSIGFEKNGTFYPKFEGYDPEISREMALHYNLGYYNHLVRGMECGTKNICFGAGDPESKLTRGCQPKVLTCYYNFGRVVGNDNLISIYVNLVNRFKMKIYNDIGSFKTWKSV